MTTPEVDDLLLYLCKEGVIKSETFVQGRKPKGYHGLFKNTCLLKKKGMYTTFLSNTGWEMLTCILLL